MSIKFPSGPDLKGNVQGRRVAELQSCFGDLGGRWELTTESGEQCSATFEETTFSADCLDATGLNGSVTLTFSGNVASGMTNAGIELSAMRL